MNTAEFKIEAIMAVANASNVAFSDDLKNAFLVIEDLPDEAQWPAWATLAARLPEIQSAQGAGTVAVFIGAQVENGMPAESTFAGVKRAFNRWCGTLATSPDTESEDEESGPDPEVDEDTVTAIANLGSSMVAHLKRYPAALEECRNDRGFMSELQRKEHLSAGIMWVLQMLNMRSGELQVFHVPSRSGFRFSYQNISNNFHLFTLLQAALAAELPDAEKVDKNVLAAARGEDQAQVNDHAWWHYGRGDLPERGLDGSVWGEGSPDEIPVIEGVKVILLWPPLLKNRSWDSGFFGPAIHAAPASVELISRLTPDEVASWWQTLGLDGPEDTSPKIICPACLSNNPESVPFCLHCEHPFPPGEDRLGRRQPITPAGLRRAALLAIALLLGGAAIAAVIAAGGNCTTGERIGCGLAAALFIVLAWLVSKYSPRENSRG